MIDFCGIFLTGSSWHTRFLAYLTKNKVLDKASKPIGEKWTARTVPLIHIYWPRMIFTNAITSETEMVPSPLTSAFAMMK